VHATTGATFWQHPAWLSGTLAASTIVVAGWQLHDRLATSLWVTAIFRPDPAHVAEIVVHHAWLPRFAMAWLAGGALAISGTVFQQVLRNPLAEPTTLGTASGAQLALQMAATWAPSLLDHGRAWVALLGGGAATLLVFAAAARRLTPLTLVLAGMVVSLLCGAISTSLLLLHDYYLNLSAAFIWSAGSLDQQSWATALYLLPRASIAAVLIALIARQLTLFELGDAGARSLGLSLPRTRFVALALAVSMTAFVVSATGIIGFIGLASPLLARLAGARRLGERLIWAPVIGGSFLCLTDQLVQSIGESGRNAIPAGLATAILGVPLMLWQTWRLRDGGSLIGVGDPADRSGSVRKPATIVGISLALAMIAVWTALDVGQGPDGWHFSNNEDFQALLPWRLPRVAAAMAAGGMLALSGALTQRLTRNPMAGPDVLGISSGAALGVILAMLVFPVPVPAVQLAAGAIGALLALFAVLTVASGTGADPERVLVVGIAITALLNAVAVLAMAGGNLQSAALLNWLAGSTYGVSATTALAVCLLAGGAMAALPLVQRWLLLLPLGRPTASALGVSPRTGQMSIVAMAGLLAAAATVVVGPLSFVGLLAPHCARFLGLRRPLPHAYGSIVLGGMIMVTADWLGRNVLFPYEVPAGLLAALIGGPYFIWLIARRNARR
jgi:ABC-type Fe3+-siderophore transport system permease subunit